MLAPRAIACCAASLLFCFSASFAAETPLVSAERETQFNQTIAPFIAQFCADCHTGPKAEKELRLVDFNSAQSIAENRAPWKLVLEKLRARTMPPADAPHPSADQYAAVVRALGATLAEAARNSPHDSGQATMRRLNRAEYNNTLRDLLAVDLHPADDFPADDVGYGFDNNGDILSLSPLLMEKYLAAAEKAVALALEHDPAKPLPESYRKIMIVDPAQLGRTEAARQIVRHFADRAFRRPVTPEHLDRLMQLFAANDSAAQPLDQSLQSVLTAVLASPQFLFRIELDPPSSAPPRQIDQWELAARLSYFLWSSMPDDELFDLARRGQLREQLPQQVHRMLQNPKAQALVQNFADQWLQTRRLESLSPSAKLFPEWNPSLRAAFHQEALALFAYIMADDRSLLEFIDAPYTFVNEPLAKFYGLEGVAGPNFRRVDLPPNSPRGGVITLAAVLTLTSNPDRTSPVKRGKWILETILGTPPPPQPPDIPALADRHNGKPIASVREQTELHRSDPACASCHVQMDPLGFGLENFDAIGQWREHEPTAVKPPSLTIASNKKSSPPPIDASGKLPDGRSFNGPTELKKILLGQRDLFCRAFSSKLFTYALGRGPTEADDAAIDSIADAIADDDYKFSRLILEIVQSEPFQMRRGAPAP